MKNCGHNTPCGCSDAALTTPPPCNTDGDCSPSKACAETLCETCITYCEDDMESIVGGETFVLKKGQNLNAIVQALIAVMNNPLCGAVTAIDLRILKATTDSLLICWDSLTPICVTLEWDDGTTILTSPLLSDTVSQYNITGLTSETEYRIRILTDGVPCASVTLITKTL